MTQSQALAIMKTGANIFLTGEPGSGKTHTINKYVAYLRTRGIEPAITASTGIAATHIGGMTIHSWSGIGIKTSLNKYELNKIASTKHIVNRVRRAKVLIIDEVSMLPPAALSMIDAVCREIKQSPKPFGGIQIILVGDFFQLPPVMKTETEPLSRFAYDSPAWEQADLTVCYITEQYRQDDSDLLALLSAIRSNSFEDDHLRHIETRKIEHHAAPSGAPKLFSHNADVDRVNDEILAKLPGELREFSMFSKGPAALASVLKRGCLSPETLYLKIGAAVMFTKNNPKEGFVNGTLGTVENFNKQSGYPIIKTRRGEKIEVLPMDWTIEENRKVRARITQLPLRLAWAITVHKSQGMSLDEAVVDLSGVFEFGQGYVALSRVRRLSGLYLLGWNERAFQVHPEVLAKDAEFRAQSEQVTQTFGKLVGNEIAATHDSSVVLSKTDYILFRECPKNVWYKIHQPDIYYKSELSDFEKHIIETGNEVELVARQLFPDGVMIEGRDEAAQKLTEEYIAKRQATLFQPVFFKDKFMAAVDILQFNEKTNSYAIYEIKASNEADKKRHYYDLAFQVNLLRKCGLKIDVINLMHLNPDYVRDGALDIANLFKSDDVTREINGLCEEVALEMDQALDYLSSEAEPPGSCCCIYKGRSNHCTTFNHSNSHVPKYSVHDISRIGNSKKKLAELIDLGRFHLHEVPEDMELSVHQRNQIDSHVLDRVLINQGEIKKELENLVYPIYFVDYETFPSAIPMFNGFSPYQQIPFQYSLYVLESMGAKLKHFEFLHDKATDPSKAFAESLRKNIGSVGNVIVWNKGFECTINKHIAERVPEAADFIADLNSRVYDLMDIFTKQHYVHKDFKGSVSIKKVLPVLAPELSYKELAIQEGGTAASSWLKLVSPVIAIRQPAEKQSYINKAQLKKDMLEYCKMDTLAMVRILEELQKVIE